MKLHIETTHFSDDQAHGALIIHEYNNHGKPEHIMIPISMPIQSLETAQENKLLLTATDGLHTELLYTLSEISEAER